MLLTCQAGFEALLARELTELHGRTVTENGPGWIRLAEPAGAPTAIDAPLLPSLAFAHLSLVSPVEFRGESVNALASQISGHFLETLRGERIEAAWPSVWFGPHELVGLGRRISAVESTFIEQLKKRLARVAKLASPDLPRRVGPVRGLFVHFVDFGRVFVARAAYVHGPRRMADDPLAPSRSYLKVEEAYVVLGREPTTGESVCDLGAAPGGWSYSAAKRGARVVAVDNGPLKGGALDHPLIEHRREDAFHFAPPAGQPFDWLFCDLVEDPHHVRQNILQPWLARGWCRQFVVNLKFGRVDPIGLLRELRAAQADTGLRIHHLYHDREEFTLVGQAPAPGPR
ncbi:SAM-dependent methyltransferase [Opitutus sp. ER46]|uniref:SAM-dependent methyltransferase n=1 Tax=Opitutus sp. ER46 TaxID=2161864 RepID=UPI000D318B4E|nr:SAM-dependent methyltransferase [Opitutus sp. ER46]PTX95578.1 rRNA methyltransferase [Opitutus sp. ER46]